MQTLAEVQTSLATWYSARDALAKGNSFSMNGRSLTRVDLDQVNSMISSLESREARLQSNAARGSNSRTAPGVKVARF